MKAFTVVVTLLAIVGQVDVLAKQTKKEKEEKKKWKEFVKWVNASDGNFTGSARLKMIDKEGYSVRGLVTTHFMPRFSPVAVIPKKLWLTTDNSNPAIKNVIVKDCPHMQSHDFQMLVTFALEVKKGEDSFWYPWIRLLPTINEYFYHWTLFADKNTRAKFPTLPLLSLLKQNDELFANVKRCVQNFPAQHGLEQITVDDMRWAMAVYQTRAVTHVSTGVKILVPGYDFINLALSEDVNTKHNFIVDPAQKDNFPQDEWHKIMDFVAVETDERKELKKGTEILHFYGPGNIANQDLVFTYGFYLLDNPNRGSKYSGPIARDESIKSPELRQNVLEMLQKPKPAEGPRCKPSVLKNRQGGILCNLARLVWETHAVSWGLKKEEDDEL